MDLQVGVGVAGREGDQPHGHGVLGDARDHQVARRVAYRGQPVAAQLVVQGLDGGPDPSAADVDVDGDRVLLLGGQRGQQDRVARVRRDRDAFADRGLQGAVGAVELDVDDGGRVVGVGEVHVVRAVGGRAGPGEPELGVRRGAVDAEQATAGARGDLGGLLDGPAGRVRALGGAQVRGRGAAAGAAGGRGAGRLRGEDGLGRRLPALLLGLARLAAGLAVRRAGGSRRTPRWRPSGGRCPCPPRPWWRA